MGLAGPAGAFEGKSVAAPDCDYGGKIKSIVATDEFTVTFTMCKPDPAFEAKAAFIAVRHPAGRAHLNDGRRDGAILDHPIGTGPFKLETWNRGDSIIMSRFDDYWGDEAGLRDAGVSAGTTVRRRAPDRAARRHGRRDHQPQPGRFRQRQERSRACSSCPSPTPNILYLGMTNTFKPFDDVKVRQAIAMGIDRQRIVDNFYPRGLGSGVPLHPVLARQRLRRAKTGTISTPRPRKTLLAEAGYPDGFETKIYYRDVFRAYLPEPGVVAVEFQTQLKQNLGIDAEVVVMESGEFIDEATAGRLDGLYLLGWGADYPHVTNFLDYHFGARAPSSSAIRSRRSTDPLTKASTIADVDKAAPLYAEANNAIKELVPMVPIVARRVGLCGARHARRTRIVRPFGAPRCRDARSGQGYAGVHAERRADQPVLRRRDRRRIAAGLHADRRSRC